MKQRGARHTDSMASEALTDTLTRAKSQKFLGDVPIVSHIENAQGFVQVLRDQDARTIIDLGSGGGVPALVIAEELPHATLVLVERGANRATFLSDAIERLGLSNRVRVVATSAEGAARAEDIEGTADAVTARSFGPPAVTAECACRMLKPGGTLIVSEPPTDGREPTRWPVAELAPTGLEPTEVVRYQQSSFQVLTRIADHDPRLPRNEATTRKRPLF